MLPSLMVLCRLIGIYGIYILRSDSLPRSLTWIA